MCGLIDNKAPEFTVARTSILELVVALNNTILELSASNSEKCSIHKVIGFSNFDIDKPDDLGAGPSERF